VREEEVREGGRGEGEVRETSLATEGEPAELRLAGPGRSRQAVSLCLVKTYLTLSYYYMEGCTYGGIRERIL
jgi:hypothetical protein